MRNQELYINCAFEQFVANVKDAHMELRAEMKELKLAETRFREALDELIGVNERVDSLLQQLGLEIHHAEISQEKVHLDDLEG